MASPQKLALIGLDSATIDFIERFAQEGRLPNIARLMERGLRTETVSVMPVGTAENWRTIVTGAYAGTHGVTAMSMGRRGEPLEKRRSAFFSDNCRAEYLWTVAEKVGKKPLLLKYTGSWPPTITQGIQVDGFGDPEWNLHEISPRLCFASYPLAADPPHVTSPQWLSRAYEVEISPATGWSNLPASDLPALETKLEFIPRTYGAKGRTEYSGKEKTFHVAIIGDSRQGYQEAIFSEDKDAANPRGLVLQSGRWSDWTKADFELPEGKRTGVFRLKLIELTPDGTRIKIYLSQVFPTTGWTRPASLAEELLQKIGPYQELSGILGPWLSYWVDEDTILEEVEYQARWLAAAAKYLLQNKEWDLFFTQWHGIDHMDHGFLGGIDPLSNTYDSERGELCWNIITKTYQWADVLVGAVLDSIDDDTLVVLTSDHGHLPVRANLRMGLSLGIKESYHRDDVNEQLAKHGLLTFKDGPYGFPVVDWPQTKACVTRANYVEINLQGREPHGIVEPEEYETVRNQVIKALDSMQDPETGDYIMTWTMKKEEARFLGIYGDDVGDVVFFAKAEYSRPHQEKLRVRMLSGNHHFYLPDVKFDLGMMHAVTIFAGPGIKRGIKRERPINMVDIAPTVANLLGLPIPANSEG
ncbi:MAG: alkaline phosphatase family protein, partial [Firmicutes bacterium]|nr:alkaline phosphatase family protein [Bacillota bacterium]